jgi:tRNA threonylcarbamoyladenosine biosynthesis protein TsaB
MILFCLDTSGPVAGAALIRDGAVRYEGMAVNAFTHSQSILPMAEEAYRRTGLVISDTDYFAVTVGPGSFTGVRIGVSTVKALAHALGKPCIAVDALEAMAAGVQPFSGVICPIQDARAGQVYGAAFRGGTLERLLPDEPLKLEAYLEKVSAFGQPMLFLGDGMPVHQDAIQSILGDRALFAPAHLAFLRPAAAAFLAWNKREQAVEYKDLSPLYLRPPQAERQKNLREMKL